MVRKDFSKRPKDNVQTFTPTSPCISYKNPCLSQDKLLALLTETPGTLDTMDITDMLSVLLAHVVPSSSYKDSNGLLV